MAIKGGDLLHVGNTVLIERAQTAGPASLNIPSERVYELGNYYSVATIFDIPDLSFTLDSLDASASLEALLLNKNFGTLTNSTALDLSNSIPLDVLMQIKPGRLSSTPYDVTHSIVTPFLTLESMSYKFGLSDKATQTATLRGDSIYYNPGAAFLQEATGTATAGQTVVLTHNAFPFNGDVVTGTRYALGVMLESGKRLRFGTDYTETIGTVAVDGSAPTTIVVIAAVPTSDKIRVVYSAPTTAAYPQNSHTADTIAKPAAIRGRDIQVFIGGVDVTDKWSDVQSVQVDYKVTLDKDEEFGSTIYVAQDFDVPDVSGNIVVKPRDVNEMLAYIRQVALVSTAAEVAGPLNTTPLEVLIRLHSPLDGSVLKDLYIPDARITVPSVSGRVQQKLNLTFNFASDTGALKIYKGGKP